MAEQIAIRHQQGFAVSCILTETIFESAWQLREVILTLGADGGLIIALSHMIERDVSIENIEAMLSAIEVFGRYD